MILMWVGVLIFLMVRGVQLGASPFAILLLVIASVLGLWIAMVIVSLIPIDWLTRKRQKRK